MDISKPLPDVPELEDVRSLDPVTAAYDKAHKRNPRYWRDMPAEQLHKKVAARKARVRKILAREIAADGQPF